MDTNVEFLSVTTDRISTLELKVDQPVYTVPCKFYAGAVALSGNQIGQVPVPVSTELLPNSMEGNVVYLGIQDFGSYKAVAIPTFTIDMLRAADGTDKPNVVYPQATTTPLVTGGVYTADVENTNPNRPGYYNSFTDLFVSGSVINVLKGCKSTTTVSAVLYGVLGDSMTIVETLVGSLSVLPSGELQLRFGCRSNVSSVASPVNATGIVVFGSTFIMMI
eukprot:TRINITY_DN7207_c0_g1_i1.p1 TRINITY_DN7207_c0_g1~~TRINITY_DN7207_c0_g1_i1.p1  ORF type:complete len:220 (-),score=21.98 TRINITY_DN7207_c0_g1_i1:85-744(-)